MRLAGLGAAIVGISGFCAGFFGPIMVNPGANQGPLAGIFITGPGGAVFGLILGALLGYAGVERSRAIKILSGTAALLVAATLFFALPEPEFRANLVAVELTRCEPPSALKDEALAHWEKRIAAVDWAEARPGWKDGFDAMADGQPGVVLTVKVTASAAVYENRKPWNKGTFVARPAREVPSRYFMSHATCAAQAPGMKGAYLATGLQSKAWPPDVLPNFLSLQVLEPVPDAYRAYLP